jgi:hypothetical protein
MMFKLAENHTIKMIAHFGKIGMRTPDSLSSISVFKSIPNADGYLPVIVDGDDWFASERQSITHRLIENDGLLLLVTNSTSKIEILQELGRKGVPGFSETGGFLGWCWPSQWHAMCRDLTESEIQSLLGDSIEAIIYPWRASIWAQVSKSLKPVVQQFGFNLESA